jgi:N-acetyl-anhydromuramyl-L-alanine amidase AmpD
MEIKETNLNFSSLTPRSKVLEYIVIHHTASTAKETVEQIHNFHINNNGWAGIGYHFYIRKDGTIYRGRPEKYVGAHCENYNSVSLGICLEGNFEIEKPTEKQIQSVTDLVKYLRKKYGDFKLVGHRDLNATACPGQYLYSQLLSIDANANEEYVKVFMSNNKLSVVLDNGDKFTHSFTDKNELLRKLSIGLKITK